MSHSKETGPLKLEGEEKGDCLQGAGVSECDISLNHIYIYIYIYISLPGTLALGRQDANSLFQRPLHPLEQSQWHVLKTEQDTGSRPVLLRMGGL